ncbi:MAG: hypothetical protein Q9214_005636, partial [Letrouitia sp. 1 TL-2023]
THVTIGETRKHIPSQAAIPALEDLRHNTIQEPDSRAKLLKIYQNPTNGTNSLPK